MTAWGLAVMPPHVCSILQYHNPGQPLVNYLLSGDNCTHTSTKLFSHPYSNIHWTKFYNCLKDVCEHF